MHARRASIDAEHAARKILNACRRGDAEFILTPQARLIAITNALFPNFTTSLLAATSRMLPELGGVGAEKRKGYESESRYSQSMLTRLGKIAAERTNQL